MSRQSGVDIRKNAIEAGVTALLERLSEFPADMRGEIAETVLASVICSTTDEKRREYTLADLSAMHVLALIRRHKSRVRMLPVLPYQAPGELATAGQGGLDELPLRSTTLGHRHGGAL